MCVHMAVIAVSMQQIWCHQLSPGIQWGRLKVGSWEGSGGGKAWGDSNLEASNISFVPKNLNELHSSFHYDDI